MNSIDKYSLEMESLIRAYIQNKNSQDIELIGVFFHELMKYATNYFIIKNSPFTYTQDIKFPFLNSEYIKNVDMLQFNNQESSNIYEKLKYIHKLIPFKKSIYISQSNSKDIKKFILKNLFKYKFKQITCKLYLADWNKEIKRLEMLLLELSGFLEIDDLKKNNFVDNFINYVNQYKADTPFLVSKNDCLLIDSNMSIQNRVRSVAFLQNSAKVVSIGHGEHSVQVFNEPMVNYAELSYVTDYITYGQNLIELQSSIYKTPAIYYRSSDLISGYFDNSKINFKPLDKTVKVLYVPTSFSENMRYGPYRDMEDSDYAKWQHALLDSGYNITYKQHLHAEYSINFNIEHLETRQLSKVMHEYDIYILDYVSTASALLFATNKPIIFFDLGLRNIHKDVKKDFTDRVYESKIDLSANLHQQIENTFSKYNADEKEYCNTYTNKYSIAINTQNCIDIIGNIVSET